METRRFVGREEELKRLRLLLRKQAASFVVIRGRRRIGKSRLIEEFGKEMESHIFSGLPPTDGVTRQEQLDLFCSQMTRLFDLPEFRVKDWGRAFYELSKRCRKGGVLIALDEISWIGSKDPQFLGHLKTAWDLHFSKNPKLVLVVCGSVSSWIERNILSSTGFVGRISLDLRLGELPARDARAFWDCCAGRVDVYEVLKVLCVAGGVPRYLEEVIPNLSAEENIRLLCFDPKGLLYQEFDRIFSDLFSSRAPVYAEILKVLAQGSRASAEIAAASGIGRPATLSDYLVDLVQAGFVAEDPTWNLRTRRISQLKKYRLSDNYLRFYLKYVAPDKARGAKGLYRDAPLGRLPGWDATMGLQFENLVLNNCFPLFKAIGVLPADIVFFGPFFQRQTVRKRGCQIDLLIQARYHTLFLCEIKFRADKVGLDTVREIEEKRQRLAAPRGWSVRTVLIHVNGVTQEVLESELLDHIVDFSQMLEL